ncbi:NlpC/P60 family protein [Lentzea sp. NPDC051838]|uniref:NlpC/P60 family protein n=1 Tax=Lentzea sp. NPDC051838 TaxID=3154849 RepID=UPI003425DF67
MSAERAVRFLALALVACGALWTGQAAAAPTRDDVGIQFNCATYPADQSLTRTQILQRARSWIDERVPYSQSRCHDNQYGDYRTDCSGMVSMAWGLRISRDTSTLRDVATEIARSDLQPGDMLWRRDSAVQHAAIFVRWGDDAHTRPVVRQESGPDGVPANETTYSASYANTFTPFRYDNLVADPPAAVPVSGIDYSASSAVVFNNQLTVFARGADGSLQHWWLVNGQANLHDVWTGPNSVGGKPVAVVYRGVLNVFYRGVDDTLQHWWFDTRSHHDVWGGGSLAGDPVAAVFGDALTVFGRGTDGVLQNWWLVDGQANRHSPWGGGTIAGNPTAVVYNGILAVFGRGTDNRLHNWWIVNGQANQHSIWSGGSLAGDATAAVYRGMLTVFGRGTDDQLHNWWIVNGQANQHSIWGGGSLAGSPAATVFGDVLTVFGRGTDNRLHNWWIVNGQANQHSIWNGGSLTNDPCTTLFTNGTTLTAFGRGTDGALQNWWIVNGQANQHSPWGGGNIAP